jgi:general secretion pathway protein D
LRPGNQQQQPQQGNQQNQQQQQQQTSSYQSSFSLEQEVKEESYYPWLGGQPDSPRTADGRNPNRPVSDLVGRVRAVADPRINSLMVSANVHFFPQVMKLIEDLDAPTAQVLIEARIVEVSSDFLDKLGVRWSPDGSKVFTADDYDNSILASSSAQYRSGFGGTTAVNTPASPSLAQTLTQLRSGVFASTINIDYLIQFLKRTTKAKVLAEPQINIADNERGQLFVGQQVPFIDKSQTTDVGALTQTFQYKDVGVVLEVTPHINSTGDVALKIRAEASSIVPGETLFGGAIIDTREFRTDLRAKTGETLVLGGIIQRQISDTLRKTPILGDIPGLGWLFKKKDKTSNEVELMVFLRPKITRTPEEARELLEEIYRKAPHIQNWKDNNYSPKEDGAQGQS